MRKKNHAIKRTVEKDPFEKNKNPDKDTKNELSVRISIAIKIIINPPNPKGFNFSSFLKIWAISLLIISVCSDMITPPLH